MEKGKLIVIEGACDGIGKTTQFKLLRDHLKNDGEKITTHHFPSYNTEQASLVEDYLKGEFGTPSDLSPYFVNSLYALDRAVTWNKELKKAYENGDTIILDRYTTSSLIYQSALIDDIDQRKKFIDYVVDFEYKKLGIKEPDIVIFLYAPFDLANEIRTARVDSEGIINDIHESNLDFMKKVYDNAMFVCDYLSWNKIKCNDKDKFKSIDEIHREVYSLIKKLNH